MEERAVVTTTSPFASFVTLDTAAARMEKPRHKQGGEKNQEQVVPNHQKRNGEESRSKFPLTSLELGAVIAIFSIFLLILLSIYLTMPSVDYNQLKLPGNVDELRLLTAYVSSYADDYELQVFLGFCAAYIFMQTFMIPGTIVMSLLAGSLFGPIRGMMVVIFNASAGASCCFFLSKLVGRPLALWMWPGRLQFFKAEVAKRKAHLFNYMLFLRITPTLPNTFINMASPIVGIPYGTFLSATILGLIPATFISVRAGLALGDLKSFAQLYDMKTLATLFFIGLVSILPTLLGKKAPSERPAESSHSS